MASTSLLFLCVSLVPFVLSQQSLKDCNGGVAHGSTVERTRYFYTCKDGVMEPQGCVDNDKRHVPIGGTFQVVGYELKCILDSDGALGTDYTGCIIKDKVVPAGEILETDKHYFTCIKRGDYIFIENTGCMHKGKRVEKLFSVREGDYLYTCKDRDGSIAMCPAGCFISDRETEVGKEGDEGETHWLCTREDGLLKKKAVGCIKEGQQLKNGDVYRNNGIAYKCETKDTKSSLYVSGCVAEDGVTVKPFQLQWTEGVGQQQFTVDCRQTGETAAKVKVGCVYSGSRIEPGCFRKFADSAVGCKQTSAGADVEFVTFALDRLDVAFQNRLTMC